MSFPKGHKINTGRKQTPEHIKNVQKAVISRRLKKSCKECNKEFFVPPSKNKVYFCCRKCYSISMRGKPTWNSGLKGFRLGKRPEMKGRLAQEKNPLWKGDDVGYRALHRWVEHQLGKPNKCSDCGKIGYGHEMHWANISRNYQRITTDWRRLCTKCHKAYDRFKPVLS